MDKKIYLVAAKECGAVYRKNKKVGSTNYAFACRLIGKVWYLVITIAGTNDILDWFWNLCPWTKDGVKYGSYLSAKRVASRIPERLKDYPKIITGHSKAAPTAAHLKVKYCRESDYCVAFEPALGFLKREKIPNMVIFIDPDDIVPKLGALRFKHPDCEVVYLPRDKKWWDIIGRIKDHSMPSVLEQVRKKYE